MIQFNSKKEVIEYYNSFTNKTIYEIYKHLQLNFPDIANKIDIKKNNKSMVGLIMEGIIGRAPNSDPAPDIKNLNIELKSIPIRKSKNKFQILQRSKIKALNYNKIQTEKWETSTLKKKIDCILFNTYEQPIGKSYKDWKELKYKGPFLYEPNHDAKQIEKDWNKIKLIVNSSEAHNLSESITEMLGACTSGTGKKIKYKNAIVPAKERSFSLKHSYLKQKYNEEVNKKSYTSFKIKEKISIETYIVNKLNQHKGQSLEKLCNKYNIQWNGKPKNSFRILINKLLKIDPDLSIRELEYKNIEIKTIPVNEDYIPWEAMSFPKVSLKDIIDEDWDTDEVNESSLKKHIYKTYIIIPNIKKKIKINNQKKYEAWINWKIGNCFVWQINEIEAKKIKKEWLRSKKIIKKGLLVKNVKWGTGFRQENNLIKMSETNFIHMRPHARDSKDIDIHYYKYSQNKIKISWQCYWFNQQYIRKILHENIFNN